MKALLTITTIVALAALPAVADDATATAHRMMREALLEHAPIPTRPPVLPDRTAPGASIAPQHLAGMRRDAEQAARHRAAMDARAVESNRPDAARHSDMGAMMNGCTSGGTRAGCSGPMPADMMKSRGVMPGGGMMTGGATTGGTSGGGMPGGGGMPHATSGSPAAAAGR